MADFVSAWFSMPVVQWCAVLFAALTVVLLLRVAKRAVAGKKK